MYTLSQLRSNRRCWLSYSSETNYYYIITYSDSFMRKIVYRCHWFMACSCISRWLLKWFGNNLSQYYCEYRYLNTCNIFIICLHCSTAYWTRLDFQENFPNNIKLVAYRRESCVNVNLNVLFIHKRNSAKKGKLGWMQIVISIAGRVMYDLC